MFVFDNNFSLQPAHWRIVEEAPFYELQEPTLALESAGVLYACNFDLFNIPEDCQAQLYEEGLQVSPSEISLYLALYADAWVPMEIVHDILARLRFGGIETDTATRPDTALGKLVTHSPTWGILAGTGEQVVVVKSASYDRWLVASADIRSHRFYRLFHVSKRIVLLDNSM